MDGHTRQITEYYWLHTSITINTFFLRTKPAWKITQDKIRILLGLQISHQHEPFN